MMYYFYLIRSHEIEKLIEKQNNPTSNQFLSYENWLRTLLDPY